MKNKFEERLQNLGELEGHIMKLAPRNHDGELTGTYKKLLKEIHEDRRKAQKWVDSQPDYSQYFNGGVSLKQQRLDIE